MKNDIPVTSPFTLIDGVSDVLPVTCVQKRPFRYATVIKITPDETPNEKRKREKGGMKSGGKKKCQKREGSDKMERGRKRAAGLADIGLYIEAREI